MSSDHSTLQAGLFANGNRAENVALARKLLAMPPSVSEPDTGLSFQPDQPHTLPKPCPCCGGRMIIIEVFEPGCEPKNRPTSAQAAIRIDTS